MEGEADRESPFHRATASDMPSDDDLRFRLDWPEDEVPKGDDELTDFSFEWDEDQADATLAEAGAPEFGDPIDPITTGRDTSFIDASGALDTVRRALDDNNAALRQLSEAVYELASNVRLLVDEVDGLARAGPSAVLAEGQAGDVTASAVITMSAELSAAVDKLSDELHVTRSDLQGLIDDVVAAAGGQGVGTRAQPRIAVELDRVHSELQALKRRLPVRGKDPLDAGELAERIAEALVAALPGVADTPLKRRRAIRVERDPDDEEVDVPAPRKAIDRPVQRRQRPLRPE